MPYMLLIVEPPGQRRARSSQDGQAVYGRMVEYAKKLQARGLLLATNSLKSEATRLNVRAGKPNVIDGPFTESKELIGGFFLLDCATLEQARNFAAEVRPPNGPPSRFARPGPVTSKVVRHRG